MKKFIGLLLFFLSAYTDAGVTIEEISAEYGEESEYKTVSQLIDDFYSEMNCFTSKGKDFIRRNSKDFRGKFAPSDLQPLIRDVESVRTKLITEGSLIDLLHLYYYDDDDEVRTLTGADTHSNASIDPASFIDRQRINFVYSLDCSGFISNIAKIEGGFSNGKLRAETESALEKQELYVLLRGRMSPLLTKALSPGAFGHLESNAATSSLLYNILNRMSLDGKEEVSVPEYLEVINFASSGSLRLQGNVTGGGNGGASFGLISGSVAGNAGVSMSQSFQFYNPRTIVLKTEGEQSYTIQKVRQKFASSIRSINYDDYVSNKDIRIFSETYRNLCEQPTWTIELFNKNNESIKTAEIRHKHYDLNDKRCVFTIKYSEEGLPSSLAIESGIYLHLVPQGDVFDGLNLGSEPLKVVLNDTSE